jgi:hypothetical protein
MGAVASVSNESTGSVCANDDLCSPGEHDSSLPAARQLSRSA